MAYITITDLETAPGKPGSSSLIRRLRDNPEAVYIGAAGTPLILRKAISAGGTGTDGDWINGTSIVGNGYFEPSSILFTAPRSLPSISILRINGDVTISDVLTLAALNDTDTGAAALHLRGTSGGRGVDGDLNGGFGTYFGGGGGGHVGSGSDGAGGAGVAGTGYAVSGLYRDWLALNPKIGGGGGNSGNGVGGGGGGCLVMLIEGDLDMTGGTINADGDAGTHGSTGNAGGGAGGSIVILCTGTLTGGTYTARGGNGATGTTVSGGRGGGGRVVLVASAFAGSRTKTVTAGTVGNGTAGAGEADEYTLTAAQIRGFMFRSY